MLKKSKEKLEKQGGYLPSIFLFSLVVFFWTLFDSVLMYVTPLLMEESGFSISTIGLIIGTSSMSGALFDFFICKFFKNSDFRRVFLIMFTICFFYPLLLFHAKTVWFFLLAMSVWGIYFDLYGFGVFNFVGRYTRKEDHASSFGIIQIFRALGGVLAPFIAGLVIANALDWQIFATGWFFLGVGAIFFMVLFFLMRKHRVSDEPSTYVKRRKNVFVEIHLWKKLGKIMTPVLSVTFFLSFVEAFFWTLSPLYVETMHFGKFGGLFLTAYIFPALFVGWFVGALTHRFGKKKTALFGILAGSMILTLFMYTSNPMSSILIVFLAACFISVALPAINAAYADYISEAPEVDSELEGVEDFSFNSGYIAGPIIAGVLADVAGIPVAFSILGLIGVVLASVLLVVMPKSIVIGIGEKEL